MTTTHKLVLATVGMALTILVYGLSQWHCSSQTWRKFWQVPNCAATAPIRTFLRFQTSSCYVQMPLTYEV